jgi:hypothetical protein
MMSRCTAGQLFRLGDFVFILNVSSRDVSIFRGESL